MYEMTDTKAIVRHVQGHSPIHIGLVGKGYKVVKMKEICDQVEAQFHQELDSNLLDDALVRDSTAYYGGMCIREYLFPKVASEINSRSNVGFRTIVINGYDGSSSFKLLSGAIDFFCLNGMVSGSHDVMMARHTQSLTIPRITDRVKGSIDIFYKQADLWKRWAHKKITDEMALEAFKAIPNISERRVEQLMHQYQIEKPTHGETVWALYSAATYYASHSLGQFTVRDTNNDHTAMTMINREKSIMSWQNTNEFVQLAA